MLHDGSWRTIKELVLLQTVLPKKTLDCLNAPVDLNHAFTG